MSETNKLPLNLEPVISWLENGCDIGWAINELKAYQAKAAPAFPAEPELAALREQLADANCRAEYWKANHIAGNKIIDEAERKLADAHDAARREAAGKLEAAANHYKECGWDVRASHYLNAAEEVLARIGQPVEGQA